MASDTIRTGHALMETRTQKQVATQSRGTYKFFARKVIYLNGWTPKSFQPLAELAAASGYR